ncbi:RidA family protein [Sphingobium sp.]|uniref:RidA family protein n=1 Tax=Sphingobium sp. TaxID=1912891 RepID=UPI0026306B4F|nr:RidA family protein [Sphingobium sp.]
MAKPEMFVTDGAGQKLFDALHMSQTLKIGNRVETSGQGGWNDDLNISTFLEEEITQAFENVEKALAPAGASWKDVVHVNSYHVGGFPPEVNATISRLFRRYMPDRAPIWTQTGVEALGLPTMRIEIRVTAIID